MPPQLLLTKRSTPISLSDPVRSRIVRLTNVHFGASPETIRAFFGSEFNIVDILRTTNTRTRTRSIVYVMFSTALQRVRAVEEFSGRTLMGRMVHVQPAIWGNYELLPGNNGFVKHAFVRANRIPRAPRASGEVDAPAMDDVKEFPVLGSATESGEHDARVNLTPSPIPELNFQGILQRLRSGSQVVHRKEPKPLIMAHVVFAWDKVVDSWNLSGHDAFDRTKNVVSPLEWYSFGRTQ